jgi:hypothetical protein
MALQLIVFMPFSLLTCIIFIAYLKGVVIMPGVPPIINVVKKKGSPCTYYFLHRCLRVTHWLLPAERPSLSSSPSWRYCAVANQPAHLQPARLQRAGSWKSFKTGFASIWQNCLPSFLPHEAPRRTAFECYCESGWGVLPARFALLKLRHSSAIVPGL